MMGIFGNSSAFDADVEKATGENNASEDWALILEICDRAGASAGAARECLRAVTRRLAHSDPHVQLHAATLLDACVANCGRAFLLEVASRDFLHELRRLMARSQPPVARRLRALLRKWAENEFRGDPQLDLVPSLYHKMRAEGFDFDAPPAGPGAGGPARTSSPPAAAAAAAAQREQDELARAIALSLRDSGGGGALYPRVEEAPGGGGGGGGAASGGGGGGGSAGSMAGRKVRALYDFEAAEDNELTFFAGEIVTVTDSSDPNWWKGSSERGEGLFPANFVSADLAPRAPRASQDAQDARDSRGEVRAGKSVQWAEAEAEVAEAEEAEAEAEAEAGGIEEAALDAALAALHEASPESAARDAPGLRRREARALAQAAAVDAALQAADRRHARLTQLSADLVDALNLYHHLMRDPPAPFLRPPSYGEERRTTPVD